MAQTYRLTGDDTLILFGRTITDTADGDIATITVDNDIAASVVGKGGNVIVAKDEQGRKCTITVRILKAAGDDIFLQSHYQSYENDSALFAFGTGSFSKRLGDGEGNVIFDTKYLKALHFNRAPYDAVINVNGNTDQAVTVYTMQALIERVVG